MNKKAELNKLTFLISIFIIVILGMFVASYSADMSASGEFVSYNSSDSSIVQSNTTLSPVEEGITSIDSATAHNNSWLEFDGVNDNVEKNGFNNDLNDTSLTISIWFKMLNKTDNEWNSILNVSTFVWFQDDAPVLRIERTGDTNRIRIKFSISNLTDGFNLNSIFYNVDDIEPIWNRWNNVVVNFNRSNLNMSMYLNGEFVVNKTADDVNIPSNNFFRVGKDDNLRCFKGGLDEIRVYNISLSQTQMFMFNASGRIANSSLPSDGLVLWYSFDEGTGTTVYDKSGNGNHGK